VMDVSSDSPGNNLIRSEPAELTHKVPQGKVPLLFGHHTVARAQMSRLSQFVKLASPLRMSVLGL
jgi:hypothetical protein